MYKRMNFTPASSTIDYLINQVNTVSFGGLDLQPPYQRSFIWKDDFKDKLIYSIVKSYPIGNVSLRVLGSDDHNEKNARTEVVDGQQRLTTIRDFMGGVYKIRGQWAKKIIQEMLDFYERAGQTDLNLQKLQKKMNNKSIILKYSDLPEVIKGNFRNYNISISHISDASELQIREYFRFLQNQERLRAGEIINSMPPTNLEPYLKSITDREKILDILNFTDDRKDFDKVFYSIVGLFDEKISFGTTDSKIQNYVVDAEELTSGKKMVNCLISQLNNISYLNQGIEESTRKRFLKYLFLLCGLSLVDFSLNPLEKLIRLSELDNLFASFFSAKAKIVESTFEGYSKEVIEELRLVAMLSKGGHSLQRVQNRMQMLAYYVNNLEEKIKPSGINVV